MTKKKQRSRAFARLRRLVGGHKNACALLQEVKSGSFYPRSELLAGLEDIPQDWPATACRLSWAAAIYLGPALVAGLQKAGYEARFDGHRNPVPGWRIVASADNNGCHSFEGVYVLVKDKAPSPAVRVIDGISFSAEQYAQALQGVKAWELGRTGPLCRG